MDDGLNESLKICDLRGVKCPMNMVRFKNAFYEHPVNLKVIINNLDALENIKNFLRFKGVIFTEIQDGLDIYLYV